MQHSNYMNEVWYIGVRVTKIIIFNENDLNLHKLPIVI